MNREEAIEVYNGLINTKIKEAFEFFAPELRKINEEEIRKDIIGGLMWQRDNLKSEGPHDNNLILPGFCLTVGEHLKYLEKQKEPEDKGAISDGFHTFNELYYYRMLYNAAFFNLLPKEWVHKSKKHHDGEECFGGGWFIVMANLPTGQISNHYELTDWDLFQIPEKEIADEWDGHTPQEAAERLHKYLQEKQKEPHYTKRNALFDKCVGNCDPKVMKEVSNKVDEMLGKEKKPDLVQQPPITYTYKSNASRDERLKAALLALLNSDLLKVKEGGYFTKQDLIEWVERIPTDKPAWSEEDEEVFNNIIEKAKGGHWIEVNEIAWLINRFKSLRSR